MYLPVGQSEAALPDAARTQLIMDATCWSEQLNQALVAECEALGPACLFANVANRLELPYCEGECAGGLLLDKSLQNTALVGALAAGAVVVGAVLLLRSRRRV